MNKGLADARGVLDIARAVTEVIRKSPSAHQRLRQGLEPELRKPPPDFGTVAPSIRLYNLMEVPMKRSAFFLTGFALAAVVTSPTAAVADSPRIFLQHALEGDNSEIMLGRLAADRARNPQVKEYGRMLAADHSQAREEVIRVGRRMGVERNRDASPEAKDERDKLQHMDGREFDREFIQYMIQDHQKDISDFRDEARENHGPVSRLASRQLPTLQKHLDMARDLDRGGDRGGMGRDRHEDRNR